MMTHLKIDQLQTDIAIQQDHLDHLLTLYERLTDLVRYLHRKVAALEHATPRQAPQAPIIRIK